MTKEQELMIENQLITNTLLKLLVGTKLCPTPALLEKGINLLEKTNERMRDARLAFNQLKREQ